MIVTQLPRHFLEILEGSYAVFLLGVIKLLEEREILFVDCVPVQSILFAEVDVFEAHRIPVLAEDSLPGGGRLIYRILCIVSA